MDLFANDGREYAKPVTGKVDEATQCDTWHDDRRIYQIEADFMVIETSGFVILISYLS